jgi:hypothetical protein
MNIPKLNLTPKTKMILILTTVTLIATIGLVAAISAFSVASNSTYPAGAPTPTPVPTATPTPSPTPAPLTNTFTVSATLNGVAVADPKNIVVPTGAYIGTVYNTVYTITSTANQPITVQVTAPTGVTGNMNISWDTTTTSNAYSVFLNANGASATMTMTVTLGSIGGDIPLVFTAAP